MAEALATQGDAEAARDHRRRAGELLDLMDVPPAGRRFH
jgi:hypothetical protein